MSAKFKSTFNNEWLTDSAFASWLQAVPDDPHRARCSLCSKTFDLNNMGRQAIVSHKSGVKHQRNSTTVTKQQPTMTQFGIVPQNDAPSEQPTVSVQPSAPPIRTVRRLTKKPKLTAVIQLHRLTCLGILCTWSTRQMPRGPC